MSDASAEPKPDVVPSTTLPPPPPASSLRFEAHAATHRNVLSGAPLRPGQLTAGWQIMLAGAWATAFFAFAAVWKTSEEIGIGTWWLGARAQPQPMLLRIAPFVLVLLIGMLAVYNVRRTGLISAVGAALIAVVAVFDMSRSGGLAAIEFAIAASMMLVSIGAIIGAVRSVPAD